MHDSHSSAGSIIMYMFWLVGSIDKKNWFVLLVIECNGTGDFCFYCIEKYLCWCNTIFILESWDAWIMLISHSRFLCRRLLVSTLHLAFRKFHITLLKWIGYYIALTTLPIWLSAFRLSVMPSSKNQYCYWIEFQGCSKNISFFQFLVW